MTDVSGAALGAAIDAQSQAIAARVTEHQFAADPSLDRRFGDSGRAKCTSDALRHLSYLASAAASGSDALFADYVGWAKILLAKLGLGDRDHKHITLSIHAP